jgi:hypothetical protein
MTGWISECFNTLTTMNNQHERHDFPIWRPLAIFGNVLLYPLKSILIAIAPQWVHSPLSSGVIWEDIYITQFMGPLKSLPFYHLVDPNGLLADIAVGDLIHSKENNVKHFERYLDEENQEK